MTRSSKKVFHTKHRQRRIFWKRIAYGGTTFLTLASLVLGIFFGSRLPIVSLSHISISGTETIPTGTVRTKIDAALAGSYFGIIPHRFMWMSPLEAITTQIESLPRVQRAEVYRVGRTLNVSVREFAPHMLWCRDVSSTSSCYYVDRNGKAYEEAPSLQGGTLIRYIVREQNPRVDEELLTKETRQNIDAVIAQLRTAHNLAVERVIIENDVDITFVLDTHARILFSRLDIDASYQNFVSLLDSKEYQTLKRGRFEYIDLRFGNKVFVQKEPPRATTTQATVKVE
jgi:cell division septal protein FtsQ